MTILNECMSRPSGSIDFACQSPSLTAPGSIAGPPLLVSVEDSGDLLIHGTHTVESGHPIFGVAGLVGDLARSAALHRYASILASLPQQEDEGDIGELVVEHEEWTASRLAANAEILR